MTTVRHGWISDYTAQGMEGERWHIFQDRNYSADRTHGWQLEGMHPLQSGDHLTIFADDGRVLWAGHLAPSRRRWFSHRQVLPSEPAWHPPDVAAATWLDWFQQQPALVAILTANPADDPRIAA